MSLHLSTVMALVVPTRQTPNTSARASTERIIVVKREETRGGGREKQAREKQGRGERGEMKNQKIVCSFVCLCENCVGPVQHVENYLKSFMEISNRFVLQVDVVSVCLVSLFVHEKKRAREKLY